MMTIYETTQADGSVVRIMERALQRGSESVVLVWATLERMNPEDGEIVLAKRVNINTAKEAIDAAWLPMEAVDALLAHWGYTEAHVVHQPPGLSNVHPIQQETGNDQDH